MFRWFLVMVLLALNVGALGALCFSQSASEEERATLRFWLAVVAVPLAVVCLNMQMNLLRRK